MILPWGLLILAGLFEVVWVYFSKHSEGFSRFYPSLLTGLALIASLYLFSKAIEVLPIGSSYAIWVGLGVFGTSILGMCLFNEPASSARIFFTFLLFISIIGLKLSS